MEPERGKVERNLQHDSALVYSTGPTTVRLLCCCSYVH